MMKTRDYTDAQAIIEDIKNDDFGRRDLAALLIYVRQDLPKGMIRDLADTVAHPNRDRGYAYTFIGALADDFLSVAEKGGALEVKPIFPRDALISNFTNDLIAIGFNVTKIDIEKNIDKIESCLAEILADTVIFLKKNSRIKLCRIKIENIGGALKLIFTIYPQNLRPGALNISKNNGFAFPMFSD